MFDKLKIKSKANSVASSSAPLTPGKPSREDIYRNRQNYGVNLGGCFVLEKWLFHSIFPEGANCEAEAVAKLVEENGEDEARTRLETHWTNFMSDDDWQWLEDHGVNSVRIPIGYWEIDGGRFTKHTKFEPFGHRVYANAWSIFKKLFVEKAGEHGISVLVDLHGLPGGANGSDHSGEHGGDGKAEFWHSSELQLLICEGLKFIVKDLLDYENICGIQIVNESEFADNPKHQKVYYGAAINLIREIDGNIPIIISDGWWPNQWAEWVQELQNHNNILGVVIDHHVYRCFSDSDKNKSPQQIIDQLPADVLTNISKNGHGVDFMVGEWSCVLDQSTWDKAEGGANHKRDELVIEYGNRQLNQFMERASYGSYFWTFKFESGNGGEWDLKTMTDKGAIKSPLPNRGVQVPDGNSYERAKEDANNQQKQSVDKNYDWNRFNDGFTMAWRDSEEFLRFNGSLIGRIEATKEERLRENSTERGTPKRPDEFESGYLAGLFQFRSIV